MLQVFFIDIYVLHDSGDTLYFFTLLVSRNFYIFPNILNEPFMVPKPVCESVVVKRVYRNFPIMLCN